MTLFVVSTYFLLVCYIIKKHVRCLIISFTKSVGTLQPTRPLGQSEGKCQRTHSICFMFSSHTCELSTMKTVSKMSDCLRRSSWQILRTHGQVRDNNIDHYNTPHRIVVAEVQYTGVTHSRKPPYRSLMMSYGVSFVSSKYLGEYRTCHKNDDCICMYLLYLYYKEKPMFTTECDK